MAVPTRIIFAFGTLRKDFNPCEGAFEVERKTCFPDVRILQHELFRANGDIDSVAIDV
jgi:hypothetical protein